MKDPRWLLAARRYLGTKEIPGDIDHPTIVRWWEAIKSTIRDDETPWCAAFVGGVLEECGIRSTRSAAARSYLKFGQIIDRPAVGCVVVFWRGSKSGWSGHVGFLVGRDAAGNLMVLGGNQSDAVTIAPFSTARVLGYRWPGRAPTAERYNLPLIDSDGKVSVNEA